MSVMLSGEAPRQDLRTWYGGTSSDLMSKVPYSMNLISTESNFSNLCPNLDSKIGTIFNMLLFLGTYKSVDLQKKRTSIRRIN